MLHTSTHCTHLIEDKYPTCPMMANCTILHSSWAPMSSSPCSLWRLLYPGPFPSCHCCLCHKGHGSHHSHHNQNNRRPSTGHSHCDPWCLAHTNNSLVSHFWGLWWQFTNTYLLPLLGFPTFGGCGGSSPILTSLLTYYHSWVFPLLGLHLSIISLLFSQPLCVWFMFISWFNQHPNSHFLVHWLCMLHISHSIPTSSHSFPTKPCNIPTPFPLFSHFWGLPNSGKYFYTQTCLSRGNAAHFLNLLFYILFSPCFIYVVPGCLALAHRPCFKIILFIHHFGWIVVL